MGVNTQSKLVFHGVDFPVINFHSTKPMIGNEETATIDIDITPKVFYPKDNRNSFQIIQEIKLHSEGFFSLFIVAMARFEFNEVEEQSKKTFININAPAIMFPYVRSFITTLTSNVGYVTGPLIIPTQFFDGELEEITEIQ